MKLRKLLFLPALALLLTGCNNGSGDSKTPPDPDKYNPVEERDFKIMCYLDYNHYDPDNPYYVAWWDFDLPFTKEQIKLTDPTEAPDPYYPTFKGWSRHALVDEDQYLFDFNTAISEDDAVGGFIELFGIFVGA